MAQAARKRTSSTTTIQPRNRRSKNQDEEDGCNDAPHTALRDVDMNSDAFDQTHEQDAEDLSTQAIHELETDITTFIRSTGKNDAWPAAFKKRVHEREEELVEKLRLKQAEREQAAESFQKTFLPFLAGCLARVGAKPAIPQRPFSILDPAPDAQPLFAKSSTLIQESKALLEAYHNLTNINIDTSSRDKLLSTLAREESEIREAIEAGMRVARAEAYTLLGVTSNEAVRDIQQGGNVLKVGAAEAHAKALARGETVQSGKTESWDVVAAESVKAFRKLGRAAREEEVLE